MTLAIFKHQRLDCPTCLRSLTATAIVSADPSPPRAGDITICAYCEGALEYVEERDALALRQLTDGQLALLDDEAKELVQRMRSSFARGDS